MIRDVLRSTGLPPGDLHELPTSSRRFPDGAQYRIEIPSTEGPRSDLHLRERVTVATEPTAQPVPGGGAA